MTQTILHSDRVILPEGIQAASLVLEQGKIKDILSGPPHPDAIALDDQVIMAGVVDPHVHVNEPGRTEWEGFETATRAAAAGGVTTLVDMPLNSDPVTTSLKAFEAKLASAQDKCWIDVGFWGGIVPNNQGELEAMIRAGVLGFKAFLIHSGIDDFPQSDRETLNQAMPILARHHRPLLVHAELEGEAPPHSEAEAQSYQAFLNSRPKDWEDRAIRLMIELCKQHQCPTHIVHLSSATALPDITQARQAGLPFTVETCPHYLYFAAEQIPDGKTEYKCMPPIREAENQTKLWQGLKEGVIDFVVTDHSPCTPGLKLMEAGDLLHAWGGIASLQFGLSSVWTRAAERGFELTDMARLMCQKPAEFAGLGNKKGQIKIGYDADLVIWSPEQAFTVTPEMIQFRHPVSPYLTRELKGVVHQTLVRGETVYRAGKPSENAKGKLILRSL